MYRFSILLIALLACSSALDISAPELRRSVEKGTAQVIIDARAIEEYQVSHLPNALFHETIDVDSLKGKEIVVYCSLGKRSAALAEKLRDQGLNKVRNLEGGIFTWANRGYPLYRKAQRVSVVHPFSNKWKHRLNQQYWPKTF